MLRIPLSNTKKIFQNTRIHITSYTTTKRLISTIKPHPIPTTTEALQHLYNLESTNWRKNPEHAQHSASLLARMGNELKTINLNIVPSDDVSSITETLRAMVDLLNTLRENQLQKSITIDTLSILKPLLLILADDFPYSNPTLRQDLCHCMVKTLTIMQESDGLELNFSRALDRDVYDALTQVIHEMKGHLNYTQPTEQSHIDQRLEQYYVNRTQKALHALDKTPVLSRSYLFSKYTFIPAGDLLLFGGKKAIAELKTKLIEYGIVPKQEAKSPDWFQNSMDQLNKKVDALEQKMSQVLITDTEIPAIETPAIVKAASSPTDSSIIMPDLGIKILDMIIKGATTVATSMISLVESNIPIFTLATGVYGAVTFSANSKTISKLFPPIFWYQVQAEKEKEYLTKLGATKTINIGENSELELSTLPIHGLYSVYSRMASVNMAAYSLAVNRTPENVDIFYTMLLSVYNHDHMYRLKDICHAEKPSFFLGVKELMRLCTAAPSFGSAQAKYRLICLSRHQDLRPDIQQEVVNILEHPVLSKRNVKLFNHQLLNPLMYHIYQTEFIPFKNELTHSLNFVLARTKDAVEEQQIRASLQMLQESHQKLREGYSFSSEGNLNRAQHCFKSLINTTLTPKSFYSNSLDTYRLFALSIAHIAISHISIVQSRVEEAIGCQTPIKMLLNVYDTAQKHRDTSVSLEEHYTRIKAIKVQTVKNCTSHYYYHKVIDSFFTCMEQGHLARASWILEDLRNDIQTFPERKKSLINMIDIMTPLFESLFGVLDREKINQAREQALIKEAKTHNKIANQILQNTSNIPSTLKLVTANCDMVLRFMDRRINTDSSSGTQSQQTHVPSANQIFANILLILPNSCLSVVFPSLNSALSDSTSAINTLADRVKTNTLQNQDYLSIRQLIQELKQDNTYHRLILNLARLSAQLDNDNLHHIITEETLTLDSNDTNYHTSSLYHRFQYFFLNGRIDDLKTFCETNKELIQNAESHFLSDQQRFFHSRSLWSPNQASSFPIREIYNLRVNPTLKTYEDYVKAAYQPLTTEHLKAELLLHIMSPLAKGDPINITRATELMEDLQGRYARTNSIEAMKLLLNHFKLEQMGRLDPFQIREFGKEVFEFNRRYLTHRERFSLSLLLKYLGPPIPKSSEEMQPFMDIMDDYFRMISNLSNEDTRKYTFTESIVDLISYLPSTCEYPNEIPHYTEWRNNAISSCAQLITTFSKCSKKHEYIPALFLELKFHYLVGNTEKAKETNRKITQLHQTVKIKLKRLSLLKEIGLYDKGILYGKELLKQNSQFSENQLASIFYHIGELHLNKVKNQYDYNAILPSSVLHNLKEAYDYLQKSRIHLEEESLTSLLGITSKLSLHEQIAENENICIYKKLSQFENSIEGKVNYGIAITLYTIELWDGSIHLFEHQNEYRQLLDDLISIKSLTKTLNQSELDQAIDYIKILIDKPSLNLLEKVYQHLSTFREILINY